MRKKIREHLISILGAIVIVLFAKSFLFESFKIPSGSMIPTILVGDHIFVNKLAYRINLPFTEYFGSPKTLKEREGPKRGEVIVFRYPKDESIDYVKRVIGLPGDTIQIRNRKLFINDREIPREEVDTETRSHVFEELKEPTLSNGEAELVQENLDGIKHLVFQDKNQFLSERFGPITIPPEKYFVMGDNRDFSDDSRFWGFVPLKNIKGRAVLIWLSVWFQWDTRAFEIRPGRSGRFIH